MSRLERDARRAGVVVAVAGVLIAGLLVLDRRSVERGNRLYHQGDASRAAETYAGALDRRATHDRRYNLGTALLSLDRDSAGAVLRSAAASVDASRRIAVSNRTRVSSDVWRVMPPWSTYDGRMPTASARVCSLRRVATKVRFSSRSSKSVGG